MLTGWWNRTDKTRREWPARSARRTRRLVRLAALVTLGWLLLAGWAPAASAMPMHWPTVPLSQLRAWLAGSPALRIPHQRGGTAAGRRHYVPASATEAGRGAGQPPGRGPGQLPPFRRRAPVFKRFRTGQGTTAGFNAATSRPVNSARSATADMYRNADGSYTKIVYPAAVNYRSATGSYLPINTTLAAAGHRWQETANSITVSVGALASDPRAGFVSFTRGASLGYGLAGAAPVAATVTGSQAAYPGALPGTDLQETAATDGIGASLVLHSAAAASTWLFPLRLHGLTAMLASDGSVALAGPSGRTAGVIAPAIATDSRPSPQAGRQARDGAVSDRLVPYRGGLALQVSLDRAWLASPARAFPVMVSLRVSGQSGAAGTPGASYLDSRYPGDHADATFLKAGTDDGGADQDRAFFHFTGLTATSSQRRCTCSTPGRPPAAVPSRYRSTRSAPPGRPVARCPGQARRWARNWAAWTSQRAPPRVPTPRH